VASLLTNVPYAIEASYDEVSSEPTLVPIRSRSRGERRTLRTLPGVSLRPGSLAFNPRPRRLSTPLLTPFNSTPTFARGRTRASRSSGGTARRRRSKRRS
jgi:hypothetical protein